MNNLLDGYQPEANMRSKVKATDEDTPPDWSFDGSSTQQAEGEVQIAFFFSQTCSNLWSRFGLRKFRQLNTKLVLLTLAAAAELVLMNGGSDLNKNSFSQTQKLVSHWLGRWHT